VTQRLAALSPRARLLLAGGILLLYAALAWLLFVGPKRSDLASARADVVAAELRLVEAQAAATNRPRGVGVPVSDVLRLSKAMPQAADQPGLVLELSRLAAATGVTLRSIEVQAPLSTSGGPVAVPVGVTVGGGYFRIARFLQRTRTLVRLRGDRLHATGRLLTIQNVELAESATDGFPQLDATITLNAYVYDGPLSEPETPQPSEEETEPEGTSAAGGTS
jgi:Tfp pilus assembly protein PilO